MFSQEVDRAGQMTWSVVMIATQREAMSQHHLPRQLQRRRGMHHADKRVMAADAQLADAFRNDGRSSCYFKHGIRASGRDESARRLQRRFAAKFFNQGQTGGVDVDDDDLLDSFRPE